MAQLLCLASEQDAKLCCYKIKSLLLAKLESEEDLLSTAFSLLLFCFSLPFCLSSLMLMQFRHSDHSKPIKYFKVEHFFVSFLFPFTHHHHYHHHTVILKYSDVTRAMSYNKGVANILPSPTHPPLVKKQKQNNTVQDLLTPNFLPSNQAILESGRTSRAAHEEPT